MDRSNHRNNNFSSNNLHHCAQRQLCYLFIFIFLLHNFVILLSISVLCKIWLDVTDKRPFYLDKIEFKTYKKYFIYFNFPDISIYAGEILNNLRIASAVLWIPFGLYFSNYLASFNLFIYYVISSWFMVILQPEEYLAKDVRRGSGSALEQVDLIEKVKAARARFGFS